MSDSFASISCKSGQLSPLFMPCLFAIKYINIKYIVIQRSNELHQRIVKKVRGERYKMKNVNGTLTLLSFSVFQLDNGLVQYWALLDKWCERIQVTLKFSILFNSFL